MKNAFTMIEVIFIIAIIGILASVAIPKLSLSRHDASAATLANNLSTCIDEAGIMYMKYASFKGITQVGSVNASSACISASKCFDFNETDTNGTLSVTNISSTDNVCKKAQDIASKNLLSTSHVINF